VQNLPYGVNAARHFEVVFEERRGTCQSKHEVIAALAMEIALPIHKYVGAYRLDDSIVEGAGPVLARHGLPYVPEIHCVLQHEHRFFDLTAGNCHGKKRDIAEMDIYCRMDPFTPDSAMQAIYELCVDYYRRVDQRFAQKTVAELRSIAAECRQKTPSLCESGSRGKLSLVTRKRERSDESGAPQHLDGEIGDRLVVVRQREVFDGRLIE